MSQDGPSLVINEVYNSIQGESTWAGLPCVFIRLTGCDLRCSWCDSEFSFYEGTRRPLTEVIDDATGRGIHLIEVTGGEPMLQPSVLPLMSQLCDAGHTVLLETGGGRNIAKVDPRVHRIMDLKCPDSGMSDRNHWENIGCLTERDEVKFVLASRTDYEWAREQVLKHQLADRVNAVLFSVAFGKITPGEVVEWILADQLPVRFQLQMHKFIWDPVARGV